MRGLPAALLPFVLASVPAVSGCVGDDPPGAATADGGNTDGGGSNAADVERFLGTWATSTGKQTLSNCPVAGTQNNVSVTLTVTKGASSDLVFTNSLAPSCALSANVVGDTATLVDGQTCVASFPNEVDTYTYSDKSTFKITSAEGTSAINQLVATVSSNVSSQACDFTEIDPYTKR